MFFFLKSVALDSIIHRNTFTARIFAGGFLSLHGRETKILKSVDKRTGLVYNHTLKDFEVKSSLGRYAKRAGYGVS